MSRFQILSLDGGGLKGIFTASFLAFIEDNTGKNIIDHFDLIAGTSTGGVIALALGLGFRPKEILEFYIQEGPKIFPAQSFIKSVFYGVKHLIVRKYSSDILKEVLRSPKYFGDIPLGKSTKRLIIPSFDPIRSDVYIYKTAHNSRLRSDYKVPAWHVAIATASAPSYFPVFINDGGVRLIDGGIWANNPAMIALAETLGYLERNQGDIALLSIGTTQSRVSIKSLHSFGGKLLWAEKAVEFMLQGQEISASNQALHILGAERFLRVSPEVPKKYSMDKVYDELVGIGQTEGRHKINEIEKIFLQHKAQEFKPIYLI